jgi:hypothetical protein
MKVALLLCASVALSNPSIAKEAATSSKAKIACDWATCSERCRKINPQAGQCSSYCTKEIAGRRVSGVCQ